LLGFESGLSSGPTNLIHPGAGSRFFAIAPM
jgi:hypothetical protein